MKEKKVIPTRYRRFTFVCQFHLLHTLSLLNPQFRESSERAWILEALTHPSLTVTRIVQVFAIIVLAILTSNIVATQVPSISRQPGLPYFSGEQIYT